KIVDTKYGFILASTYVLPTEEVFSDTQPRVCIFTYGQTGSGKTYTMV
ncbi:hypothetical protein A2U01_0086701, partial [Trifolium medium]|nr:hypothetical protein [Trifolium medium]